MAKPAIFVHDAGEHRLNESGRVVALTAKAFDACGRDGLAPCVLDDLVEQPDICRDADAYQRWQLSWLAQLDAACQLDGAARSCAHLIVAPVDSLVVNARMLAGAADALAPESITYVGKVGPVEATGYHRGHLQFWPSLGDVPLSARLLPLIAEARAIPFTALPVHETVRVTTKSSLIRGAKHRLSRSLGPYRRSYRSPRNRRRSTTLMLWYAGYGAKQLAADERRAGRDTAFITRGTQSFRIIDPAFPPHHSPSRRIDLKVDPTLALGQEVLTLLEELDEWAGVSGASRILESRLAVYLHGICRTVLRAARLTRGELSHFGIDRLAAANPSSLEEYACLLAARSAHIPRLLVQHGDHLLPYGSWLVSETVNFDDFAASDPTIADEFADVAMRLGVVAPRVTYYAPRIASLLETAASQRGAGGNSGPGLLRAVVSLRRLTAYWRMQFR